MSARDDLGADCSACVGLCCVGPGFAASADFAIDKPARTPCPHLRGDDLCDAHDRLVPLGFAGCVAFDCFGAGQLVTRDVFPGRHWRDEPRMFDALDVVRALQEIRWYLHQAREHPRADPLRDDVDAADARLATALREPVETLLGVDVDAVRREIGPLLGRVADLVRAPHGPDLGRADLAGADFRGADLRGAELRGALLVGADLTDAELARANLLGADLRGADVRGADLGSALFLTRSQIGAARGDSSTRLPAELEPPARWMAPPHAETVTLPTPAARRAASSSPSGTRRGGRSAPRPRPPG